MQEDFKIQTSRYRSIPPLHMEYDLNNLFISAPVKYFGKRRCGVIKFSPKPTFRKRSGYFFSLSEEFLRAFLVGFDTIQFVHTRNMWWFLRQMQASSI